MAIKWKSTVSSIGQFFKKGGLPLLFCIVLGLVSSFLFWYVMNRRFQLSTEEVWQLAIPALICGAPAVFLGLGLYLKSHYSHWLPKNEDYYAEWKQNWLRQQKLLILLLAIGLAASVYFFKQLISRYDYYYVRNYATGYVMILTAFVLFAGAECAVILFMKKRLDQLMECMAKINRGSVAKAIETEKKSIDSMIRSEKLKVDLISNVSHDLKTPLTSIVGYIDLMKKEELNDTMKDYVEVLSSKTQKLKEMIENLFSLAKTSSGNIELKEETISLNRLVEQIYADMEDNIKNSGMEFVLDLTEDDTELVTDNSYMYRICQNLMENALKYSAQNTRIFLKTALEERSTGFIVRFEITNTANYRMNFTKDQIVERFARGDEARTSDGNGLGLAIVSTYTSALNGSFDVNLDCDQFKAILRFEKDKQKKAAVEA